MKSDCECSRSLVWLWAWLVALSAGCRGSSSDARFARYVPEVTKARQALDIALKAWQGGHKPGTLIPGVPATQVVDSHRKDGQQLASFEIVGEVPGEGPRCFSVKLSLRQPDEHRRARFVVVGIDPMWVFNEEDYAMVAHWECMPEDSVE